MKEIAQEEKAMRETESKWPETLDELTEYIESLTDRTHDYGTCVYAMSLAAVATFNYMSHVVGASGFQAGCADLDFLRRTRGLRSGFTILDYEKLLYPQYLSKEHFPSRDELLEDNKVDLARLARQKLAERETACPEVRARWTYVASLSEGTE